MFFASIFLIPTVTGFGLSWVGWRPGRVGKAGALLLVAPLVDIFEED